MCGPALNSFLVGSTASLKLLSLNTSILSTYNVDLLSHNPLKIYSPSYGKSTSQSKTKSLPASSLPLTFECGTGDIAYEFINLLHLTSATSYGMLYFLLAEVIDFGGVDFVVQNGFFDFKSDF